MAIDQVPELYIKHTIPKPDLFVYDLKMTEDSIKSKVNLNMHMFSFLQAGKKQVHLTNTSVLVNNKQAILLKKGNALWSELLDKDAVYYCKLFFFSDERLHSFLNTHLKGKNIGNHSTAYFTIENDAYITAYLNSLTAITQAPFKMRYNLLSTKFDELLLYLLNKYEDVFCSYLFSLINKETSSFKKTVESQTYTTLSLEEIAFLCHMSLSTFKRHFIKTYNTPPGQWLRNKRLQRAKELLENGNVTSSDIYLDLGYNNLSNFSSAFKSKFGFNPSDLH